MSDDEIQEAQPSTSAVAATQNASVTVINRHLNIAPFQLTRDSNDTAVRWAKWKKNIERQFRFFGIEDPQLKKDGLIIHGGQEIADLDDSTPDPRSSRRMLGDNQKPKKADTNTHHCYKREDGLVTIYRKTIY